MQEDSTIARPDPQSPPETEDDSTGAPPALSGGGAPSAGAPSLETVIQSTPEAVREALAQMLGALAEFGLSPEDQMNAEIVLAEVLNNVVEHAHAGDSDGTLHFHATLFSDRLTCRIEDDGAPMPGNQLPAGRPQELDVELEDLPEGGFGWFLIRDLTSELEYLRQAGNRQASANSQITIENFHDTLSHLTFSFDKPDGWNRLLLRDHFSDLDQPLGVLFARTGKCRDGGFITSHLT